jgi:hypothetical protein
MNLQTPATAAVDTIASHTSTDEDGEEGASLHKIRSSSDRDREDRVLNHMNTLRREARSGAESASRPAPQLAMDHARGSRSSTSSRIIGAACHGSAKTNNYVRIVNDENIAVTNYQHCHLPKQAARGGASSRGSADKSGLRPKGPASYAISSGVRVAPILNVPGCMTPSLRKLPKPKHLTP